MGGGTGRPVLVAFIPDFCVVLAGDTFVGKRLEGDGGGVWELDTDSLHFCSPPDLFFFHFFLDLASIWLCD